MKIPWRNTMASAGRGLRVAGRWAGTAAALVAVGALLAATLPGLVGYHNIIVTGGSMGHALPAGSVAVTHSVDSRDVRAGDIIAFRGSAGSATVVHRIVEVSGDGAARVATTRGDANRENDAEPLALTGRGDVIVYSIPWAGYALVYARTPAALAVLAVVGVLWSIHGWRGRNQRVGAHATRVATS